MKSFISNSRFIQPRRFESAPLETHNKEMLDESMTERNINRSATSPDCVESTASEESIADILCNLEQIYDRSISKWDKIRKTDELEHAMMRGITCYTNEADIPSDTGTIRAHEKNDATKVVNEFVNVQSEVQLAPINVNTELKSQTKQCTYTQGNASVFDMRCFLALTALLLILLRFSYAERICTL
jgi:hypothetical protein